MRRDDIYIWYYELKFVAFKQQNKTTCQNNAKIQNLEKARSMLFFQIDVLHLDLHMQSLQSDFSTAIYECTWKKKIKVNTKFVFAVTIKFILLSQPLFILQTCQKMALLTKFCDARNEMNICKLDHSCCFNHRLIGVSNRSSHKRSPSAQCMPDWTYCNPLLVLQPSSDSLQSLIWMFKYCLVRY